jgi:hypothetical protein
MANHCYNYGYFHGDAEQINKLITALETEKTRILKEEYTDKAYPRLSYINLWAGNYNLILSDKPDDYTKEGYDVYDLYGSKWFTCEWEVDSDKECTISGDSAWSPVLPFFAKICKKYNLTCEGNYEESGMDFAGRFVIDEGGNVEDEQMTYLEYEAINNPDSFWDNALELIEVGNFIFFEDVLDYFKRVKWELSNGEIETLTRYYKNYLQELANQKGK